jgi:carbamate kinase
LAALAREHTLVLTHGNGPQIGYLAALAESEPVLPPYPLDVLGAESAGFIGYLLEQALLAAAPGRPLATVLSQVEVDACDPAFAQPSKPIGPVYDETTAARHARERGWMIGPDRGGWRRLVASPEPRAIVALASVRILLDHGVLVITLGGGGIPVCRALDGSLHGVAAVIDKDLASALLACELCADALIFLTDVAAVFDEWGSAYPRAIGRVTPRALRERRFAAGSMGPKVEAACRFVERTGQRSAIGALGEAAAVVAGRAGTQITVSATRASDE